MLILEKEQGISEYLHDFKKIELLIHVNMFVWLKSFLPHSSSRANTPR